MSRAGSSRKSVISAQIIAIDVRSPMYAVTLKVLSPSIRNPLAQEVEKYNYKFLREEKCGELECFVVESYPLYKNSGYTRLNVWWDKDEYRVQKIDFYDRKDSLLKTLTYNGYQQYKDKFWRADKLSMVNHQTGKSTDIVINDWEFSVGQNENEFTPARLKRAK